MLPDAIGDRHLTEEQCPKPANKPLEDSVLWPDGELPDWKLLKDFMTREGKLTKEQIIRLLKQALEMFKKEPNLV